MATNIVLADAQATPVNHTFIPVGLIGDVFWFEDQSQANAVGYWKISVQVTRPAAPTAGTSSKDRVFRVKIGLHEPVMETIGNNTMSGILPAPTVAFIPRVFLEYVLPERATLQNRKDLRKMLGLLNSEAQITNVVENLTVLN